jgi:hypothetical protein
MAPVSSPTSHLPSAPIAAPVDDRRPYSIGMSCTLTGGSASASTLSR